MYSNKLYLLLITAFLVAGCYKESDYNYSASDVFENIEMDISNKSLLADGKSSTEVTYRFPSETDVSLTKLKLTLSSGTFSETGTKELFTSFSKLDESETYRYENVKIISSTVAGHCVLTTELNDYKQRDTLNFTKAFPEKILASIDPFYIKTGSVQEINITVSLDAKDNGVASKGHKVMLKSTNPAGLGFFNTSDTTSREDGKARFKYVFTDSSYVGEIKFTAVTINDTGDSLTVEKRLQVLD